MKKKFIALLAAAGLAAMTGCAANAPAADGAEGQDKVLKVAGTGVSYPHSFKEGNDLVGFDTEVIAEAAERAGYTVEFSTMDFPGLLGAVQSGKIDTTATNLTWTEERAGLYVFSSAYAFDGVGLSVHEDSDVQELADLDGATIAAGTGTTNLVAVEAWIQESGVDAKVRAYDTAQSALQDTLVKRVEALARPYGSAVAQREFQGLELRPLEGLLTHEQTRFPFADNERGRQLADEISSSLEEMLDDGSIAELSEKYFTYDRTVADGDEFSTPEPTDVTLPEQYAAASPAPKN